MSTFTAQILVGHAHPNEGGILNVSHTIFLSENSHPAWILQSNLDPEKKVVWIPTSEGMLEDAIVMASIYILKDTDIIQMAEEYIQNMDEGLIRLHEDISSENLQKIYERVRQIQTNAKFIINVYAGSTIQQQLDVLKDYDFDLEVCQSVYRKEYSEWTQKREEYGLLDSIIW